jgi:hypothetical protein
MAHNQEYKKEESDITVHGSFTVIEDDIDSPPSDLKSNFISIEEWLGSICDEDFLKNQLMNIESDFLNQSNHTR